MKIIEIKNLKKDYVVYDKPTDRLKEVFSFFSNKKNTQKKFKALNGVSFDLKKGEILGIIGENGAGKSTLLKILSGVVEPTSGDVKVNGKVNSILELGSTFNPELTGYENIEFYLQIQNILDKKLKEEIVENIVEFSELGSFLEQPVKTYSSGMFARLAFATAINSDFEILIVDEVLSVGDIKFQNKCINTMKKIVASNKSVIYVSHDMHSIKYFCDRVIHLESGEIKNEGSDVFEIVEMYEKQVESYGLEEEVEYKETKFVKIDNMYFTDMKDQKKKEFNWNEEVNVFVEFEIFEPLEDMFFGIGFRNSSGDYVNGLNTSIDKIKVPNKKGKHKVKLKYKNININSNVYEFWSVFYNKEGSTILADYFVKNALTIKPHKGLGEGIVNLEHEWEFDSF